MHTITKRIADFNAGRIKELLPHKYQTMSKSMFAFFRGSCHVFYEDLQKAKLKVTAPVYWICGDLHLENFGSYKGDNRLVYFDLNDFDEAIQAPVTWEIVSVLTSIRVAFASLKIDQKKSENMVQLFLKTYTSTLQNGKSSYIEPRTAKGIVCDFLTAADSKKNKDLIDKKTEIKKSGRSILMSAPRHIKIDGNLKRELKHHIDEWIMYHDASPYNFEVVDIAFRLAGTSSIGLKRYVFLLKSLKIKNKHILVEMKQAMPSCLAAMVKIKQPNWPSEGERIVAVQRMMQNVSPALSSATIFKEESYIVQEMQPHKDSFNFLSLKDRYRDMYQVIDDMAVLTASAQLRSSGRMRSATADELVTFATRNDWQERLILYSTKYLKIVEQDYAAFKADIRKLTKAKPH